MKMGDNLLEIFFRRKRFGQFVIRIENAGVLNPSHGFDFPGGGYFVGIENRTGNSRAVSLRANVIGHIVCGDTRQEASAGR